MPRAGNFFQVTSGAPGVGQRLGDAVALGVDGLGSQETEPGVLGWFGVTDRLPSPVVRTAVFLQVRPPSYDTSSVGDLRLRGAAAAPWTVHRDGDLAARLGGVATHDWATIDRFEIANQPVEGTNYRIVNRNSGKPLAVADGSTADGALIVQKTDGGAWTIDAAPGGAYTLKYVSSGKALDVDGYSSTVGHQLQQWTPSGGTNQQWYLRPTDDGYFTIVSHDSGLVADVYGWDTGDGAKVVQYTSGGGANQQWKLVPA